MAVDSAARVVADIAAAGGQAVAAQFDLTEEAAVVAGIAEKRWSGRRSWASELGPENITVNFVAPGWIPVERHRNVAASDMAQYPGQVPLGRQGPPAELAAMVVFLASPRADFITGQTFAVTAAAPSPERQPFAQQSPGLAEPVPSVTESIVPQASPAIVYASHSPSSEIVALTLDSENGSLRELSRIVVPHEGPQETGSLQLALARRSRRLYAALPAAPFVLASFRIELPSAELRLLGTTTLPRHSGHLTLDAAERRLFSVSYSGHLLTVSPVGPGGEAGSPIVAMTTSLNPHGVVAHPGNGLLYVGAMRGNRISAFRLSDDGTLVPRPEAGALPRPSVGPKFVILDASGSRLYLLNEYDATIDVFAVEPADGGLRQVQSVSILPADIATPWGPLPPARPGIGAGDIQLSPDGRFLFASDRPTNSLTSFRVDPTHGTLRGVGAVEAEPIPRSFVVTEDGRWLIAAGFTSGRVASYSIDQESGALHRQFELGIGDTVDAVATLAAG